MHVQDRMMGAFQMTALSRASRLHPIMDGATIHTLRGFQTFTGLHLNNRRPKAGINVEITDDGLPKDYRLQVCKVSSRRLDAIICKVIGQGRKLVFHLDK